MFFRVLFLILATLDILWWIWADRRLRPLRTAFIWRRLLGLFIGTQMVFLLMWIVQIRMLRNGIIPAPVVACVFIWHLLVLPITAVGHGLLDIATTARRRLKGQTVASPPPETASQFVVGAQPSRRQLLAAAGVAMPPLLLVGGVGAGMKQLGTFRIRRIDLPLAGLPPHFDGLTIAHVSDIHVGRFTTNRMLANVADATNGLKADLVLLTGDLIDYSVSDLPGALDFVKRLDPRHGLAMCIGNHDLVDSAYDFVAGVRRANVPLLVDQVMPLRLPQGYIDLYGVNWEREEKKLIAAVNKLSPRPGGFPILMAHHPHAFDPAALRGFPLTLSGHTHGGQLMLNERLGCGPVMFRYWSGVYRKGNNTLVVSNGVGNWFPLRIQAPAEIIHLTLRVPS